ncbi:MAG: restriction endonuclease subunit S, partial [Shewanella sp.]
VRATIGDLNWADKEYCLGRGVVGLRAHDEKLDSKYLWYFIASIEDELYRNSTGSTFPQINKKVIESLKIPLPPLETQKKIAAVLEKADQLRKDCKLLEQELNSLAQSVFIDMFGDPVTNPKGWDKHELSKVLSVNHGYAFKSEYFTSEGDYVLLTPGNFKEEGGYWDRGEKQKYYSGEIPSRYILEKNDLLLAMTEQAAGLLGSSILVPESNKYLHNQRLGLVKFKNAGQNTVFYSYLFNNKSVRLAIHSSSTGTKVKHTSPTKLESIKVGVPPSSLQKEFELIIKTIEQNIALNNKAKDDYEQSFNALMQKAFKGELNL